MIAAKFNRDDVVQNFLVEYVVRGKNIGLLNQDGYGRTPAQIAFNCGHYHLARLIDSYCHTLSPEQRNKMEAMEKGTSFARYKHWIDLNLGARMQVEVFFACSILTRVTYIMKKMAVISLSLSVLLSSCASVTNEGVGSLTGGVVGGLLGSQFGGGSGKVMAAAGGALLGAFLGGKIGKTMDRQDQLEMQRALETAPTGGSAHWTNPDNGNQYSVKPTRTYYSEKQPCREYITHAMIGGKSEQIYGKACRQKDGSWRVQH